MKEVKCSCRGVAKDQFRFVFLDSSVFYFCELVVLRC